MPYILTYMERRPAIKHFESWTVKHDTLQVALEHFKELRTQVGHVPIMIEGLNTRVVHHFPLGGIIAEQVKHKPEYWRGNEDVHSI